MKLLALHKLLEEQRVSLCQIKCSLKVINSEDELGLKKEDFETYDKAITRIGNMINSFFDQVGYTPYIKEHDKDSKRISRLKEFRSSQKTPDKLLELRTQLGEALNVMKDMGKSKNKIKYQRVLTDKNTFIPLTGKYISQRKSSMRYLNDAVEVLDILLEKLV